jgi:hypothetical protein
MNVLKRGTHEINNGKTANPSCFCLFEWTLEVYWPTLERMQDYSNNL